MRRFLLGLTLSICSITYFLTCAIADSNISHYVRTNKQITFRDGTRVPIGANISVKSQDGENWIPLEPSFIPSIPKFEADLIELKVFNPLVEGTVVRLTSVYERTHSFRSFLISRVAPSSWGLVLSPGDKIKIVAQEGDFYVTNLRRLSNAMIPIASVNVAGEALFRGVTIPVPTAFAQPLAPAVPHSPPRPGSLHGRLKVPFTLGGKVLSVGDYITLAYDGGDEWLVLDSFNRLSATISKAGVEVIDRTDFLEPLTGRITKPTIVYRNIPDLTRYPGSLDQSEAFSNLNPSVRVGDEVYIRAQEGSDYIVEVQPIGSRARPGRIPVAAVDIVAGDPNAGVPITIAPPPQSKDPAGAGYVAPPPSPALTDSYSVSFSISMVLLAAFFAVLDFYIHRHPPNVVSPYNVDRSKWSFDQQTGEYHRYSYKSTEGDLIDTRTHNQIGTERLHALRQMTWTMYVIVGCALFAVIVNPVPFFGTVFLLATIIAVIAWSMQLFGLMSKKLQLPPPPVAPRGLDDVEEQKAYGDASAATIDDIHAALGGGGASAQPGALRPSAGHRFDE